jgi:hypothetical protein
MRLETLLAKCIIAYDAMGDAGGGCDGADVKRMAELVFADRGVKLSLAPEVVNRWGLGDAGARMLQRRPAALLVTGVADGGQGTTGCTFVVLFCPHAIHVVDSHRHDVGGGTSRGWVWAQSPAWQPLLAWLFDSQGLLEQLHCRTDFVEVVVLDLFAGSREHTLRLAPPRLDGAPIPPPAPQGMNIAQEPVAVDVAAVATARAACLHAKFDRKCARCRWAKHEARFCQMSAYRDGVTFDNCVAVAPAPSSGPDSDEFAIGCKLCARLLSEVPHSLSNWRNSKWHTFRVCGDAVSFDGLSKHLKTGLHRRALEAYAARGLPAGRPADGSTVPEPADTAAPAKSLADAAIDESAYVPRKSKFEDAIRGCVRGQTGGMWAASHPSSTETLSPLITTGVFRDESRIARRKMLQSAAAVLDEEQREMLKRAVRIAFSDDDRDQQRILRIRVVWTHPRVGYAEFFGALLQDYGFDADACKAATLQGLQSLCRRRTGNQLQDAEAQLDESLWDAVRCKIFCGATDGAAVALKGVQLLAGDTLPALRYQFRDRPHTTRTCVKMAFELCPESHEMQERLITGPQSFARRAKNSRRFREIWMRKQKEDDNLFWNVCQDLGYAKQRYDSRSRPMSTFCERLGPALQVLSEMSRDLLRAHARDAKWARELLESLSGPAGFLKMVMFAIDTDFAVATHKLVRVQDKSDSDVSLAAREVQECLDVCRVLFSEGRIFDRAPNGTYTNRLLTGFAGVSQQVLLGVGGAVQFGWPNPQEDGGYLMDAVRHAKKLYKGVHLFFMYNFPHHAWRTRFEAFNLATPMSQTRRRGHIMALAEKEGVDPVRSWEQCFEALPHVTRSFQNLGDSRAAWSAYLDDFCRTGRSRTPGPDCWRPRSNCIAQLVLTYLGIMDGSSDVERAFSHLQLAECARAHRHHKPQVLQDILKVRLHAPPEFRDQGRLGLMSRSADAFLERAQAKYGEFFGRRRLASRSMMLVAPDVKRALFAARRPRWQHLGPKKGAERSRTASLLIWETDVQRWVGERRLAPAAVDADAVTVPASFVAHSDIKLDELLPEAEAKMAAHGVQQHLAHREAESRWGLAAPPQPVKAESLLGKKRKAVALHPFRRVAARVAIARVAGRQGAAAVKPEEPQGLPKPERQPKKQARASGPGNVPVIPAVLKGIKVPDSVRIHLSGATVAKHRTVAAYLAKKGLLVSESDADAATHHIFASRADRVAMQAHQAKLGIVSGRYCRLQNLVDEWRAAIM